MSSFIKKDDEDFQEYLVNITDLAEMMGINIKNAYREIDKITDHLMARVLYIDRPEGLLKSHWVSSFLYHKGEGKASFAFDPRLKPYLLDLKSRFTIIPLDVVLKFSSMHSIRLYSLLKQYESVGSRTLEIEDLRNKIGATGDSYKEFKRFNGVILKKIRDEFSEKDAKTNLFKSDISFETEVIKKSGKAHSLKFIIKKRKAGTLITTKQAAKTLNGFGIKKEVIDDLTSKHSRKHIQKCIEIVSAKVSSGSIIKNQAGYLISLITSEKSTPEFTGLKRQQEVFFNASQSIGEIPEKSKGLKNVSSFIGSVHKSDEEGFSEFIEMKGSIYQSLLEKEGFESPILKSLYLDYLNGKKNSKRQSKSQPLGAVT